MSKGRNAKLHQICSDEETNSFYILDSLRVSANCHYVVNEIFKASTLPDSRSAT